MDERETLYKEYARLHKLIDDHMKASFAEFKQLALLGAAAALALKFLDDSKEPISTGPDHWGISIALIAAVTFATMLAMRDLLRRSIIAMLVTRLADCETQLNGSEASAAGQNFRVRLQLGARMRVWYSELFQIEWPLAALTIAALALIPGLILWSAKVGKAEWMAFGAAALAMLCFYLLSWSLVFRRRNKS